MIELNENIRQSFSRKCSSTVAVIFGGGGEGPSQVSEGIPHRTETLPTSSQKFVFQLETGAKKTRIIGWFKIIKGYPPFVFVSFLSLEDTLESLRAFLRTGLPCKGSNVSLKRKVDVDRTH